MHLPNKICFTCAFSAKHVFLMLFFAGFVFKSFLLAQPVNNVYGDVVMPPPEMASLGKFTDIELGMHTGTPSIGVPIHTLQEGSISVPISLGYHASGVKVGEPSGMVGLGWALNAGGRIMRTVVGKPDEGYNGYLSKGLEYNTIPAMNPYFPLQPNTPDFQNVSGIISGLYDGEADVFSFSFGGYSGKFIFDSEGDITLIPKQNLKITVYRDQTPNLYAFRRFTITTPDGTKYHFGVSPGNESSTPVAEEMFAVAQGEASQTIVGWMLVAIESFDYAPSSGTAPLSGSRVDMVYESEIYGYKNLGSCTSANLSSGNCSYQTYFKVRTKRLKSINTPNDVATFVYTNNRQDLRYFNESFPTAQHAKSLDTIKITDNGVMCKRFIFSYDYWIDNTLYATGGPEDKRLRLNAVQETSCDGTIEIPSYTFTYIGGTFLPNRMSKATDHWGFYNGADENNNSSGLNLPNISEYITYQGSPRVNPGSGEPQAPGDPILIHYPGESDRNTHQTPMLLGTLNKITYPTGGEHIFEYEANDYRGVLIESTQNVLRSKNLGYPNNYTVGCNTISGSLEPSGSISFTTEQLEDLEYEIRFKRIGTCSNSSSVSITLNCVTPACIPTSITFSSTNENEEVRTGNLRSLFPAIQAGNTYTFSFSSIAMIFDVKIFTRSTVQTPQNIQVGGLRVRKVQIKDGIDEANTIVKTYRYTNLTNDTESSGVLYNYPRYWLNVDNFPTVANGQPVYPCFNCTSFFDYSVVPLSDFDGSHIGYTTVIEDHEGNGRKEFVFFTEAPSIGLGNTYEATSYPYPPDQLKVIAGNEQYSTTWAETGERLELSEQIPLIASYEDVDGVMVKATTSPIPGQGTFIWQLYRIKTRIPYLVSESFYDLDGVKKRTNFEYDGISISDPLLRHYFPTAVSFNNSDGKIHRTETEYAYDQGEANMLSRYMIAIPIKQTSLVDGNITGGYRKVYNANCYPIRYYELLQGGGELLRGEISTYNTQGLPTNFIPMGFDNVLYQWGSNRMLTQQKFINWQKNWTHYDKTGVSGKTRFLQNFTDVDGQVTNYQYDQLGRLIQVSARNGNIVTQYIYSYGGPNSITSITEYTDAPTQTIEKQFDGLGRSIATIHNGVRKEEIFYDQYNRVHHQTYLPGNYTYLEYEPSPLNRATREIYPDGNFQRMRHGAEGNYFSTTVTNERGFNSTTNTDILGRKSLFRDALGGQTIWRYEDRGHIEGIDSPAGTYKYTYDIRNRLETKVIPGWDLNGKEIYHYCDNNDLLTQKTDPNGNRLRYEYDNYGRLTKTYLTLTPPGSSQPGGSICGPGSGLAILESQYFPDQIHSITTNRINRVVSALSTGSGSLESIYTYDAYGRTSTLNETYPAATVSANDAYTYTYNHADWMLSEHRDHQSYQGVSVNKDWGYDNFGRVVGEVFGGGVPLPNGSSTFGQLIYVMAYNDRDQMLTMKYGGYPRFLDQANFSYNERGWMTGINELVFANYNVGTCDIPPWTPFDPQVVEQNLSFTELVEQLVQNPDFTIRELDPCNYGDCFRELSDYQANLSRRPDLDCIEGVYLKDGKLIDLPRYPYCVTPILQGGKEQFVNDLKNWLTTQGYTFETVEWIVDDKADPAINYVRVTETDAPMGKVSYGCGFFTYAVTVEESEISYKNIKINAIYDNNGELLNLPNYPYSYLIGYQPFRHLRNDLIAWFQQESLRIKDVTIGLSGNGIRIVIGVSELPFGRVVFSYPDKTGSYVEKTVYFSAECPSAGGFRDFVRYGRKILPCERLQKPDPGTDSEQPASIIALDQAIAQASAANLTYPTVLYKVRLNDGQYRWVFSSELPIIRGRYKREDRVPILNAQQQFTIRKSNGQTDLVDVAGLIAVRAAGMLLEVVLPPGADCGGFPPLGCTPIQQEEQQQSLGLILSQLANLNPATLNYPVRLVLVRLCDGSTMYMLEDMLSQLEGPYLILDGIDVSSPNQMFTGTFTTKRDPIFAMDFPNFEPNGDILRANWQVATRRPQFYTYGYDPLDRLTGAQYGEIVSTERPTANGGSYLVRYDDPTDVYSVPSISYDGAGNITALQRKGRYGENCENLSIIDALSYQYDQAPRLSKVTDSAPAPANIEGFRPGSDGRASYLYDYNGNMTFDPHKNLTITYNFLNLPQAINGTMVVYDATGRKLRLGSGATARETFNGIDFVGGKLEGILHDKGRLAPEPDEFNVSIGRLRSEYWRQDHLGNTRVAFSDQNENGIIETRDNPATPENEVEIMQENHYYPFGMNHKGRWYGPEAPQNRRTYNGKEYTPELGLDWYDYGARWYDAALGRWGQVDPMAEEYASLSPYAYVANNPLIFIDPDGRRIDPSGILNSNNKLLIAAFIQFAKSEAGIELLSKFAQKGQTVAGHTFEEDGEFHQQGVTLSYHAWEGNYEDADGDKTSGGANGVTRTQETEGGTLGIEVFINAEINSSSNPDAEAYEANPNEYTEGGYISSRAGTLFHETVIHAAADAKDYVQDCRLNCSNTNRMHGKNPNTKEGRRIIQHLGAKDSNSEFRRKYIPAIISIYRQNGTNLSNHEIQRRLLNFQD